MSTRTAEQYDFRRRGPPIKGNSALVAQEYMTTGAGAAADADTIRNSRDGTYRALMDAVDSYIPAPDARPTNRTLMPRGRVHHHWPWYCCYRPCRARAPPLRSATPLKSLVCRTSPKEHRRNRRCEMFRKTLDYAGRATTSALCCVVYNRVIGADPGFWLSPAQFYPHTTSLAGLRADQGRGGHVTVLQRLSSSFCFRDGRYRQHQAARWRRNGYAWR